MTAVVLDASAVLALLMDEPGAGLVRSHLDGAILGSVNLAEIVSFYAKNGASQTDIESLIRPLPVRIVPADIGLAYDAGMLRPITLKGGLSIGDRYCLALARREGVPVLTAERQWPTVAVAAGVEVRLIR